MEEKILKTDHLMMGVDYYPEHWDETLWESDIGRMKQTGIERIRIAEFAWNIFEPSDGEFTFDFFDRFLSHIQGTGMKVIFGTPTATPPAWLTTNHPEVLNARIDGVKYRHGGRRHYTYNSPVYNEYVKRIVEQLGAHYGKNECVAGWQIDNEINCEVNEFYSDADTAAFREFLREKYGTLAALNEAWGTVFWNQTYTAWEEVSVPQVVLNDSMNPHRRLDFIRFISGSARKFVKMQSDILRTYCKKGDFITTNGLFGNLDNHAMTRESLDFLTYDSYPDFAFMVTDADNLPDGLRDRKWSSNLAEVRSVSPVFGIMEQQSGAGGWTTRMKMPEPRPGQIQLWTLQSIANGADYIGYFRWRTSPVSTEIYWHGILDYSGRDNRRLSEIQDMKRRMNALSDIAGSRFKATFAVLKDYDNKWDNETDTWLDDIDSFSSEGLFAASEHTHTPVDYVYVTDGLTAVSLGRYKAVFYPHPAILAKETMDILSDYVTAGGTVVFGCRTGLKDIHGQCVQKNLPAAAQNATGADVVDFTCTAPDDEKPVVIWQGSELDALKFIDVVQAYGDGEIVGRYGNNYYAGQGAVVRRVQGKGSWYYYGSTFSERTATVFLEKLGVAEPYGSLFSLPGSVELLVRENERASWFFILNYQKDGQTIAVRSELENAEDGSFVQGTVRLKPYQGIVLKQKKQ